MEPGCMHVSRLSYFYVHVNEVYPTIALSLQHVLEASKHTACQIYEELLNFQEHWQKFVSDII